MGTLSDDLRIELCQVWARGFLEAMAGGPLTDEDYIPSDMAPYLVTLAESSVDGSSSLIAELYRENPTDVYQTIYEVGRDLYLAMATAYGPIEVNLN